MRPGQWTPANGPTDSGQGTVDREQGIAEPELATVTVTVSATESVSVAVVDFN